MSDEDGTRTQPEFGLGERLASLEAGIKSRAEVEEALQSQIDRRLRDFEKLHEEKIQGVRTELSTASGAQKQAIDKAEEAQRRQTELLRDQADKRAEVTDNRLGALERGESVGAGRQLGSAAVWGAVVVVLTLSLSGAAVVVALVLH